MHNKLFTALAAVIVFFASAGSALAQMDDSLGTAGAGSGDKTLIPEGFSDPAEPPASASASATAEIRTETIYVSVPGPTRTVTKWRTREIVVPKDIARKGDIERLEKAIGELRKEVAERPTDQQLQRRLAETEKRLKDGFGEIATVTWQELRAQTPAADAGKEESMEIGTVLLAVLVAAGLIFFSFLFSFLLFTRPRGGR